MAQRASEKILLPKTTEKNPSDASGISAAAVTILATTMFALIPLFVNPHNPGYFPDEGFISPKFGLLLRLSGLLLLAMTVTWLSGAKLKRVPVLLPTAVFLATSALSTASSEDVYLSLVGQEAYRDGLLTLAAGVFLFYAAARFLDSWLKVRFFLTIGVISTVLVAIYGILQRFGFGTLSNFDTVSPAFEASSRVFSTVGNPIYLAAYLTLMMGCTTALYFTAVARWERVLWLSVLAALGACWLYTYTRGAMLGAGVSVPVVLWLAHRS